MKPGTRPPVQPAAPCSVLALARLNEAQPGTQVLKIFAAFSASLLVAASAVAADTPRPIDRAIAKVMERGWPGVAVLVESADGTVQTAAAGSASLEQRTPMTPTAGFHMCSITKTFTAVATLRLVDEGNCPSTRR